MAGKTSDRVADQRKEIVDHVIEEMGKGGFSWLKPWADSASPHNPVTGSTYHGRNRMHLAVMAGIDACGDALERRSETRHRRPCRYCG